MLMPFQFLTYRCLDKYIHRCSNLFIPKIWHSSSCEDANNNPLLALVWIQRRTDQWYKLRLKPHQNYQWMAMPSTLSMPDIPRCRSGRNRLLQCRLSMLNLGVNLDRCLPFKCPTFRHSKRKHLNKNTFH